MNVELSAQTSHREREIVVALMNYFSSRGIEACQEVPNMGTSIDFVARRDTRILTIEAKINKWKDALKQCSVHEHIADYIMIAVALRAVPHKLYIAARERGYGVLRYDFEKKALSLCVRPKVNKRVWAPQKEYFLRQMEGAAYDD